MSFSRLSIIRFLLVITPFFSSVLTAATYFVDFENGNDLSDGTSRETAWKHIPGTRRGGLYTSEFAATSFGSAAQAGSKRLPAGTVVRVKSGTRYCAEHGGAILIDHSFYGHGIASQPIVVERDPDWGQGSVEFDGSGMPLQRSETILWVDAIDHFMLDGRGPEGFVFRNSPQRGIGMSGSRGRPMTGLLLRDCLVSGAHSFGVQASYLDSYLIERVLVDGKSIAGNGGFHFGAGSCNNGSFRDCVAHHLGDQPGAQRGGDDIQIGFWLVNARNVTYLNCVAHTNEGDGFDVGLYNASEENCTDVIKYVGCTSFNNADGFGMNAGEGLGRVMRIYCVNSIAYGNHFAGFHAYGGAAEYVYAHVLSDGNRGSNYFVGPDGWSDQTGVTVRLYNSIGYRPTGDGPNITTTYIRGSGFKLDSDHNYWRSTQADGGGLFCYWDAYAGTNPYAKRYEYRDGPGATTTQWYSLDEDGHLGCDGNSRSFLLHRTEPNFANELSHDYSLRATSGLRGKGTDLRSRSWFVTEMQYDRAGVARRSWDIGPYECAVPTSLGVAGAQSAAADMNAGALPGGTFPVAPGVRALTLDGRTGAARTATGVRVLTPARPGAIRSRSALSIGSTR